MDQNNNNKKPGGGVDSRILTTETTVELGRIFSAATREYVVAEAVGGLAVEDTFFLEEGESVGIEHFCPFVAVITGCVTAREDVAELGRYHSAVHVGTLVTLDTVLFEPLGNEGCNAAFLVGCGIYAFRSLTNIDQY